MRFSRARSESFYLVSISSVLLILLYFHSHRDFFRIQFISTCRLYFILFLDAKLDVTSLKTQPQGNNDQLFEAVDSRIIDHTVTRVSVFAHQHISKYLFNV